MGIAFGPESIFIAGFSSLSCHRYPHRYPQMGAVTPLFWRFNPIHDWRGPNQNLGLRSLAAKVSMAAMADRRC